MAQQNRLLGPFLILILSKAGISFLAAWKILTAILLLLQSLLVYFILRQERLSPTQALSYLVLYWFAFLVLQSPIYYVGDQIDMLVFTLLAYGIVAAKPLSFHVVLFVIALLNRESALIIAVYVILSGFALAIAPPTARLSSRSKVVIGTLMLAGGALYTHFVRRTLFVSRPDGLMDVEHDTIGNHLYFFDNLAKLFFENFRSTDCAISISLFLGLLLIMRKLPTFTDSEIKATLITLVILATTIVFGSVTETRVYFTLIPFALMLTVRSTRRPEIWQPSQLD